MMVLIAIVMTLNFSTLEPSLPTKEEPTMECTSISDTETEEEVEDQGRRYVIFMSIIRSWIGHLSAGQVKCSAEYGTSTVKSCVCNAFSVACGKYQSYDNKT